MERGAPVPRRVGRSAAQSSFRICATNQQMKAARNETVEDLEDIPVIFGIPDVIMSVRNNTLLRGVRKETLNGRV